MTSSRLGFFILLLEFLLALNPLAGQDRSPRREAVYRAMMGFPSLVRGGTVQPNWLADGIRFWYADSTPDRTVILVVDPVRNTVAPLFDPAAVRRAFSLAVGHEPAYRGLPFSTFTFQGGEQAIRFAAESREWVMDRATHRIRAAATISPAERERQSPALVRRAFPRTAPDVREILSPDGRWFLGERDGNLVLRSSVDGRVEALTTDAVPDYVWTIGEGRSGTGYTVAQWAPNGLRLAALKMDTRAMGRLPIVHWLKTVEEVEWRPYAKTGAPTQNYEIYVVDVLSKRAVRVAPGGEPDDMLAILRWLPDGSELLILRMNRVFQKLELIAANPTTGASRVVHTETQPTFIKGIGAPAWASLFTPLDDGKRFLLISERDGWDHLYLYAMDGTLIRRLTSGQWPVLRVVTVDLEREWVYFTAHAESRPYDTHVYRVSFGGQGLARLTEGTGTHLPVFSPSKTHFLDTHSDVARPPVTELRSAEGRLIRVMARASIDSLRALGWRPPEPFVVKAADRTTELHGILYRPVDFDSTRKYPVVEYIYGGPQLVNVPHSFIPAAGGASGLGAPQAMAQLGFVVVTVDARGTTERGKAFQDVVYRNFGRNEIPDHVGALRQLFAQRPYLDSTRVGIYGISWGGYMTLRAMVLAPEIYRVGVSTYPVGDLWDHWDGPIEPYMDLPQRNLAGYEYASSLRLVNNLRGPIMVIGATSDMNASFSATMKMVDALNRAGKPYNLQVYLEQNHAFEGVYETWHNTVGRFFEEQLKP